MLELPVKCLKMTYLANHALKIQLRKRRGRAKIENQRTTADRQTQETRT
jgi:hypothetical protein